jgi:hypothetical protein
MYPNEAGVRRLLELELAVLEARLVYPIDKVLEQLEQIDKRTSLSPAAMRRILERLNTRLAKLNAGG